MRVVIAILFFFSLQAQGQQMLLVDRQYNGALPTDISGLLGWWKADDGPQEADTTPPEDGETVTQWNDLSGNGYHLTGSGSNIFNQNEGYLKKPFITTIAGGYFYNSSITGATFTSGLSAYIVFATNTASTDFDGILTCWNGGSNDRSWAIWQDTLSGNDAILFAVDADGVFGGSVISSASYTLGRTVAIAVIFDASADQSIYKDGVLSDTDTSPTMYSGAARFEVASYNTGAAAVKNQISVAEIILFNTALSTADHNAMLNYLSWRHKTF